MARNAGPKARVNRRLGALIYESAGAARAYERFAADSKRKAASDSHQWTAETAAWALNELQSD